MPGTQVDNHWFPRNDYPMDGPHDMRNAWAEAVRNDMARKSPVTVAASVVCDFKFAGGRCIIMSVDDKASYGDPPLFSTKCGKFADMLPEVPIVAAISGDISACDGVIAILWELIRDIKKQREQTNQIPILTHKNICNAIRDARHDEYVEFLSDSLQGYLGMKLEACRLETNPEIMSKCSNIAKCCMQYFPVGLLVAGFLGKDWIHFKSQGAQKIESGAQPFATGIGGAKAQEKLSERNQNEYMSVPRSLLHLAEAMETARLAYPKHIGKPSDYMVLRPNKPIMRFNNSSANLQRWIAEFRGRATDEMQSDTKYREEFESDLYEYKSSNVQTT